MTKTQYGIIEGKHWKFPVRDLLMVPHRGGKLTVSHPAFGPNSSPAAELQKLYSHPITGEKILFRMPTTAESISVAAFKFEEMANPKIFDSGRGHYGLGLMVQTSEGVFANPPRDALRNIITDEKTLKSFLNRAKPVKVGNGVIYIVSDTENLRDFGYAEYDSFKRMVQDCGDFVEGGLARVLEHTESIPENLKEIASPKFYRRGVDVQEFDNDKKSFWVFTKEPSLNIALISSGNCSEEDLLIIRGRDRYLVDDGVSSRTFYTFGVLD